MTRDVVVVGAINVDMVVASPTLPGPGETVVGRRVERHGGGKGANAAVAAARAGARVRLIGAVGRDDDGVRALDELRAAGIDLSGVAVLTDEVTGVALISVSADGENQIAVGAGANAAVTAQHVRRALAEVLPNAGCVLVSTEIPGAVVLVAVEAASTAGVPCILNPAPVIPELAASFIHQPLLTPNAPESAELDRLVGLGTIPSTVVLDDPDMSLQGRTDTARRLAKRTGAPVVTTLGGLGALVVEPSGAVRHVPARLASARDTTGAGDTFNGVLATRLAHGDDLARAVLLATTAASLSVTHLGAREGMPTGAAIRGALTAS